MKSRTVFAALAAVTIVFASLLTAAPASAATVCNPQTIRYKVTNASVPLVIAVLSVNTNFCRDSVTGAVSSSGSITNLMQAGGSLAGWNWMGAQNSLSSRGTTTANYQSNGAYRLCVPTKFSPLCSFTETFSVRYVSYIRGFIGPQVPPVFACTNSYCKLHFTRM